MTEKKQIYEAMLDRPHPVSRRHPQMPRRDRAAQFAPFAALTGYEAAIQETSRHTECQRELAEDEKQRLDEQLRSLQAEGGQDRRIVITYFLPDERKAGGRYRTVTGKLKKIDGTAREILLVSGLHIPMDCISQLHEEFPDQHCNPSD